MSKYLVAVLGCTAAAGLCASPAFAQSSAQSPAQPLPPVEVQQHQQKPKPAKTVKKPARAAAPETPREPVQHAQHEAEPPAPVAPAGGTTVAGEAIASKKPATSDTAQLLSNTPGVAVATNGGISSWPAIHSMADERVTTEVDGMVLSAACPNHMNPALS